MIFFQDPNWQILIRHCSENGGYTGCDLPDFLKYEDKEEVHSEADKWSDYL